MIYKNLKITLKNNQHMYLLLSTRESEAQERYISDLSQIRLEEIKKVRLDKIEADKIIKKLLDKNYKKETITLLENMIKKEIKDKKQRMRVNITNTDSNLSIVEEE